METEGALFARVKEGRAGAWEAFVGRYERMLHASVQRLGLSSEDTHDVAQRTWALLYQHAHLIEKPASVPSWILTTARREAGRVLRMRRPAGPAGLDHVEDGDPMPDEVIERFEQAQLVREAVQELGHPCSGLISALYLEPGTGSYADVAERLGMPLGSVGPTRLRCLAKLARALEGHGIRAVDSPLE